MVHSPPKRKYMFQINEGLCHNSKTITTKVSFTALVVYACNLMQCNNGST